MHGINYEQSDFDVEIVWILNEIVNFLNLTFIQSSSMTYLVWVSIIKLEKNCWSIEIEHNWSEIWDKT